MKIGIPRALLAFEYPVLITEFLKNLDINVVLSDYTNQKIINDGLNYSIDESCLASKIFIGHVINLIEKSKKEKIDYILIPRVGFFGKRETVCVKFYALYDICKNMFDFKFLCLNIDKKNNENEFRAFVNLGKKLGKHTISSIKAYIKAKKKQMLYDKKMYNKQIKIINNGMKNILIVSHPYIINDKYLGENIIKYLNDNDINVILSDVNIFKINSIERKKLRYKQISKSIYWKYNINLLNGIVEYKDKIDGIIYLSVFPCGTDALANNMAIRKVNSIPSLNIILDEQNADAGIITRLESFIDIINAKEKVSYEK